MLVTSILLRRTVAVGLTIAINHYVYPRMARLSLPG